MKWFLWLLIFLAFFAPVLYIGKGIDHLDIMKERYKRALDAGVSSAARAFAYEGEDSLAQAGFGFGASLEHSNNIMVDKGNALDWFYRVFYRNLGIENNTAEQGAISRYIPMKAIAAFDRLLIADVNDSWVIEERYELEYKGKVYLFTLSDQVMDSSTGTWARDVDFGIAPEEREALVSGFIRRRLNEFLSARENAESSNRYYVNISSNGFDHKTDNIRGISFIVMAEGLPLPSLNPGRPERFYAFALGGSEISRISR